MFNLIVCEDEQYLELQYSKAYKAHFFKNKNVF